MAMANCVDCGKALSTTAVTCGGADGCSSTDPFGRERSKQRSILISRIVLAVIIGLVILAFKFHILTIHMVRDFFAQFFPKPQLHCPTGAPGWTRR